MDNYKKLNLVQFAKDRYSYRIDTKGSYSQNDRNLSLVFKHYTGLKMYQSGLAGNNDTQEDVIFVYKDQYGAYFYTNVTKPSDQGCIIDFIAYRNQLDLNSRDDLATIAKILSSYSGDPAPSNDLPVYESVKQDPRGRNAQVARHFKLLPEFNHPEYLLARGIDKSVLTASEFEGKVGNNVVKDKKGNQVVNIAFPLVDEEDNLCGVEYNNISFDGLQADADHLIWRSNLVNPGSNVEAIVIGATAVDLISYAQVNKLTGKNVLFLSHPGQLNKSQVNTIQCLIDQYVPQKVILAENNDVQGYGCDIMLMGALNKPVKGLAFPENDFRAEITVVDKVNAVLVLNLGFADFNTGKVLVDSVVADFNTYNQSDSMPVFKVMPGAVTYGKHTASIVIRYRASAENMRKASEIVARHRAMGDFIVVDKPTGVNLSGIPVVNWNEFLMTSKDIHKDDVPGLMYKFKAASADENSSQISHTFKPEALVQLFFENWDKGISDVQEAAVEAGVSIDVLSHMIAKHQLIAFNNYIEAVQRVYGLDFVGFKEFEDLKQFIADNEERYKEIVAAKKSELQIFQNELTAVKRRLRLEGDELGIEEYQELTERMSFLEDAVKAGKKSLGTHNEYLDAKFYNELIEIVAAKAKKVWDKTVREAMSDLQTIHM